VDQACHPELVARSRTPELARDPDLNGRFPLVSQHEFEREIINDSSAHARDGNAV
jgi:hypothetical protein